MVETAVLTLPEAARYLRLGEKVVRRLATEGTLRAFRTPGSARKLGEWRIPREAADEYLREVSGIQTAQRVRGVAR